MGSAITPGPVSSVSMEKKKTERLSPKRLDSRIPNWLKGSLLVLTGAFLWGTLVVVTKGASHLDPFSVATVRAALASLGCFSWLALKKPRLLKVSFRSLCWLFLYGGATCAFSYAGFTVALRDLSVAASEVIFYTFPLFTTILGIFILKERPTGAQFFSCFLIVAGVLCMTALTDGGSGASFSLKGTLAAVLSMVGMTIQSLVGRKNALEKWISTETLFSYAQLFGCAWIAFYKTLTTGWSDIPGIAPVSWLLLFYMGFITTFLGYGAYNLGLRYISAASASMLASFEMVTAVVLAAAFLKTPPTRGEIIGCAVILTALALGTSGVKRRIAAP
jgi:drug/metabolite transporter (DMT)-like permease